MRNVSTSNSITYDGGAILTDGHWYQLKGEFALASAGGHVTAYVYLYDLGANGMAAPALVKSKIGIDFSQAFANGDATIGLNADRTAGVQ